ncbi:MAG: IclR family transcriptional regulator [Sphingomonas bacterium]|uniref:IclR family transcriptional regulator n=1 Tax=Sphingomonas bacterium TaxID=1895847 RepID=UPI002630C6D3|nr:IclR family transcriptional regulator [Sphingomonas bacterium]MDB5695015.1 IclR family transcriptional regulator [Sphingomonas bacterium]
MAIHDSNSRSATLDKGLALLALIVSDGGRTRLSTLADQLGLAQSTTRRLAAGLRRQGFIAPADRGHYVAGHIFACARDRDMRMLMANAGRAPLRRLARELRATVHLAVLEDDMVTYLVKEQWGAQSLFTRELKQLEAYCSGLGKVLLAHLPDRQRDDYLGGGPFVALTERTIVDPDMLREELKRVRSAGCAFDRGEIVDGLSCVAVPIYGQGGDAIAALSASFRTAPASGYHSVANRLRNCASLVSDRSGISV